MSIVKRGFIFAKKVFIKNRPTKPVKMGNKLLLLLSAPCAQEYFDSESVREQFKDYDLAIVNNMLVYSEQEMHEYRPRYIVIFDPAFYTNDVEYTPKRERFVAALGRVDWDCYLITTSLAEFPIKNEHVKYLRVSPFIVRNYNFLNKCWIKNNWLNFGSNSVIHGALYYGITFGYENIAVLGCMYDGLGLAMKEDGLHILGYSHYYDPVRREDIVSNEELQKMKHGYITNHFKRGYYSYLAFDALKAYAKDKSVDIVNFSRENKIDAFITCELKD